MEAISAFWTPGVQDGVISGLAVAALVTIAGVVIASLRRIKRSLIEFLRAPVGVPTWFILLIGFSGMLVEVFDKKWQLLSLVGINFGASMLLLFFLMLSTTRKQGGSNNEGNESTDVPSVPSYVPDVLDSRIVRTLLVVNKPDAQMALETIAHLVNKSDELHLVLHRLEVLVEAGYLKRFRNYRDGDTYLLSPRGRAYALTL